MNNDKPEQGKIYNLTGGGDSIASGNSWKESVVRCLQCDDDSDSMTAFTQHQICGKCTRKNHKKAIA